MKKNIRIACLLLALLMPVILLNGCGSTADEPESESVALYSKGIDQNGFWKGIKALDYIEDFNYKGMSIPKKNHEVLDDDIQYLIDTLMAGYVSRIEITDRAVADGDTVNIDYEGKVDGVVFEGGSTMEVGVDVVIGAADDTEDASDTLSFLDDFLEQLVGQMPGDTVDITVTFPDDYYDETQRGKEAVFETTINYIVEREELTDEFVKEKLSSTYGWTTVEEMREGLRADVQEDRVQQYIAEFLRDDVPIKSLPDSLMQYQEDILLNDYQELADYNGLTLEKYLQDIEGYSSVEDCIEDAREELEGNATYSLVIQAVAEDAGIAVSEEDMTTYSTEHLWSSDISVQIDYYGLPYVKQAVLTQKVLDYITENAVFA